MKAALNLTLELLDIIKEYLIACIILPFAIAGAVADLIFSREEPGEYFKPAPDEKF